MGLAGLLIPRFQQSKAGRRSTELAMLWSTRSALVGWIFVGMGAALLSHGMLSWLALLAGWALLEVATLTWSTSYTESFRLCAIGARRSASRPHRKALHAFMTAKSSGASMGCAAVAFLTPPAAPFMIAVMALGCWWILERGPHDQLPARSFPEAI
jgi:hypothetical protein